MTAPATKHTPGPWTVAPDGEHVLGGEPTDPVVIAGTMLADWCSETDETSEANARLIAAAPNLLAALETALSALNHAGEVATASGKGELYIGTRAAARAAIAKATGQEVN
jgi:hypothetical protein